MKKYLFLTIIIFCAFYISEAQLLDLTERQFISLSLDAFKKAIQQERVGDIVQVMDSLLVVNDTIQNGETIKNKITRVFSNAKNRTFFLNRPNHFIKSNMWDFDILNQKITIQKDSAYVDCELAFWASHSDTTLRVTAVGKRLAVKLAFVKKGPAWRLCDLGKAIEFIETFGLMVRNP